MKDQQVYRISHQEIVETKTGLKTVNQVRELYRKEFMPRTQFVSLVRGLFQKHGAYNFGKIMRELVENHGFKYAPVTGAMVQVDLEGKIDIR